MTKAVVSSGRSDASDPLKARPTGVRTASTMTASGMGYVLSFVGPAVALHGRFPRRSHSTGPLCPANMRPDTHKDTAREDGVAAKMTPASPNP